MESSGGHKVRRSISEVSQARNVVLSQVSQVFINVSSNDEENEIRSLSSSSGLPASLDDIPNPGVHPRIFIERDYRDDALGVQFSTDLPPELVNFISRSTFKKTIEEINALFMNVEKLGWGSIFETILNFFSCYLIAFCRKTYYEKCLEDVGKLIDSKNQNIFKRRGLRMVHPIYHGLRLIEIIILDHEWRN